LLILTATHIRHFRLIFICFRSLILHLFCFYRSISFRHLHSFPTRRSSDLATSPHSRTTTSARSPICSLPRRPFRCRRSPPGCRVLSTSRGWSGSSARPGAPAIWSWCRPPPTANPPTACTCVTRKEFTGPSASMCSPWNRRGSATARCSSTSPCSPSSLWPSPLTVEFSEVAQGWCPVSFVGRKLFDVPLSRSCRFGPLAGMRLQINETAPHIHEESDLCRRSEHLTGAVDPSSLPQEGACGPNFNPSWVSPPRAR